MILQYKIQEMNQNKILKITKTINLKVVKIFARKNQEQQLFNKLRTLLKLLRIKVQKMVKSMLIKLLNQQAQLP